MINGEVLNLDIPGRTRGKEVLGSPDEADEMYCILGRNDDSRKYLDTQRERCDRYVPNHQLSAFLIRTRLTSTTTVALADPS